MNHYLNQAAHNQYYHDCIEEQFVGKFYDWKITVLFYVAIHYLKELADVRGVDIGQTHVDIEPSVNPDRHFAKMRISKHAWREYKNLFNYSRTARYEGITDDATFEQLKRLDHSYCLIHLQNFKKYIRGQGIPV